MKFPYPLRRAAAVSIALSILAASPAVALTVTTLADSGAGSLREAITAANAAAGADFIEFAPGLTGTITLASKLPDLGGILTVQGPGAKVLTVQRGPSNPELFRIFKVPAGAAIGISGLTISQGATADDGNGGGIANYGYLELVECLMEDNVADYFLAGIDLFDARGGAIFNGVGGNLTVERCTFRRNSVRTNGSAICSQSTLLVRNSTFSDNRRNAIWHQSGSMTLDSVTVTRNDAGLLNDSIATLTNTIVAGNIGIDLELNEFFSPGSSNNFTGLNPQLGPLLDNGGPTPTHRPYFGSPVRNAGSTGLAVDQRGVARPFETAPEIGAVEYVPGESLVVTTLADENDPTSDVAEGTGTSLREALAYAKIRGGSPVVTFAPGLTGIIQLLSALPNLNYSVAIQGPGAGLLTVRRQEGASSLFVLFSGATVNFSGLTIANTGTGTGSAIANTAGCTVTVAGCVFSGHATSARGAAIFSSGLACTVTDSTFTGNTATIEGGAIYSGGVALTVERCTFSGNTAASGGAIYTTGSGTATLRASTLYGNTATLDGGGAGTNGGGFTLENCTLSGNSADRDGGGFFTAGNAVSFDSVTALLNRADSNGDGTGTGGGLRTAGNNATLVNCIVAQNLRGTGTLNDDVAGSLAAGANNFLGGNPQLEALGQWGGPTLTHRPLAGSPVINTGATPLAVDQRGVARPQGSADDIGAHEFSDPVGAAGLVVTTGAESVGSDGLISLREAIANANAQGGPAVISIGNAAITEIPLTFALPAITGNVSIVGPAANLLTVRRSNLATFRIFHVAAGATAQISGLTILNGMDAEGGGLLNEGTATLTACALNSNIAINAGGGVRNLGTLAVESCSFRSNTSQLDGGGIFSTGPLTIRNSTFSVNSARRDGGGLLLTGRTAELDSVTITQNGADSDRDGSGTGAGLLHTAALTLQNTIVSGNTRGAARVPSDLEGSAPAGSHNFLGGNALLGPYQNNGGPTSTHAPLVGSPVLGAGQTALLVDQRGIARPQVGVEDIGAVELIFTPGNESLIVTTLLDENNGTSNPIYGIGTSLHEAIAYANTLAQPAAITFSPGLSGTILLQRPLPVLSGMVTISAPAARSIRVERGTGGNYRIFDIAAGANVTLNGFVIANGLVNGHGGGLRNLGTLTVADCTITGNSASGSNVEGGGIYNTGTLTVRDTGIDSNFSTSFGAGICNRGGAVILDRCALYQNSTPFVGGGIYCRDGSLTTRNCTISGNTGSVTGGGLVAATSATMTVVVEHCTITRNTTADGFGGGLYTFIGSPEMCQVTHSIIAGNAGGDVRMLISRVQSNGWNLIGSGTTAPAFTQPGDVTGLTGPDLRISPLALHGGPMPSHILNFYSPAANAGNPAIVPAPPALDGRGFPRIADGRIDIGATESVIPLAGESLVVNTAVDEDDGTSDPTYGSGTSLREAIGFGNDQPGPSAITFAPGLALIPLGGALPVLRGEVSINSPGVATVVVTRSTGGDYRIFEIANGADVSIGGLEISNGKTDSSVVSPDGGGILNSGALTVDRCLIYNNQASTPGKGGGISNRGSLIVRDSALEFNGAGGGLHNSAGTALVERTLFRTNGDGAVAVQGGALQLRNCTVSGNPGGIDVSVAGTANVEHCTIADNGGAGISKNNTAPDAVRVNHCIAIRNSGGDVVASGAAVTSDGWNLIGVGNGIASFNQTGDQAGLTSAAVRLNGLGNNGGPFLSQLPRTDSPARNAGNPTLVPAPPALDVRGFPRIAAGRIDIGAVETVNLAPVAGADTLARYPGRSTSVPEAALLANDTDLDGNPLAIASVTQGSSGQGSVTRANGYIFYDPAPGFTGGDTFTYTVTDGFGGSATATVSITLLSGEPPSDATIITLEPVPGGGGETQARLAFTGVPGRTYRVQASDDLGAQPIGWQTIATVPADALGKFVTLDPPPLPPRRFYRAVFP